jgi:hypothetical protein
MTSPALTCVVSDSMPSRAGRPVTARRLARARSFSWATIAGRRDQQGIASELTVGLPGTVGLLRCCAGVAEVDALVVGVAPDG